MSGKERKSFGGAGGLGLEILDEGDVGEFQLGDSG